MIKKLLSVGLFIGASALSAQTALLTDQGTATIQNSRSAFIKPNVNQAQKTENINGVTDTLYYTYNKHTFRNTAANANQYWIYTSPWPSSTVRVTHFGAIFQNTGTITVNGLEAMMSRKSTSTNSAVPVHVLLYNVVNGLPVMPAIDSIGAIITGTSNVYIGDDFNVGRQITGDYAVLYRCASTSPGDSILAWSNNASTFTSTATTEKRYGEGFGVFRVNGVFAVTTDYLAGVGNDREFIVAPRVQFNSVTSVTNPTTTPCVSEVYTYTGSSSYWMDHRQYNLNTFHKRWKPFLNPAAAVQIPADSVFVWTFGDATGNQYPATGTNTISHTYTNTAVGTRTGTFSVNYQTSINYTNRKLTDRATFTSTVQLCSYVGINEQSAFQNLNVFPNPAVNGKVFISGLTGVNTVSVYNVLGQVVSSTQYDKESVSLDLVNQPEGSYLVKITNNANNAVKVVKLINQY